MATLVSPNTAAMFSPVKIKTLDRLLDTTDGHKYQLDDLVSISQSKFSQLPTIRLLGSGLIPLPGSDECFYCPDCRFQIKDILPGTYPLAAHLAGSNGMCKFLSSLDISYKKASSTSSLPGHESLISTSSSIGAEKSIGYNHNQDNKAASQEHFSNEYRKFYSLEYELSPDHLTEINRDCSRVDDNEIEKNRRLSFDGKWNKRDIVKPSELALNGFIYAGPDDRVQCYYCKVYIDNWQHDQPIVKRHFEASPDCKFARGQMVVGNKPDILYDIFNKSADTEITSLGIITDNPKYPELALECRRMDTFLTWPSTNFMKPENFVPNGLYYSGGVDSVRCYYCAVEMKNWKKNEDVWVRHARESPKCHLVIREKGVHFIEDTLKSHGRYSTPAKEPVTNNVNVRALRPRFDAEEVHRLIANGVSPVAVKNVLIEQLKYGEPDFNSCPRLMTAVLDLEVTPAMATPVFSSVPTVVKFPEAEVVRKKEKKIVKEVPMEEVPSKPKSKSGNELKEQAKSLKSRLSCKICMDNLVGIIFLPCGHLVCCVQCASAMQDCPLCRKQINGRISMSLYKTQVEV